MAQPDKARAWAHGGVLRTPLVVPRALRSCRCNGKGSFSRTISLNAACT